MNSENPFERYEVGSSDPLIRIDKHLTLRFPTFSRTYFQYLIENGSVLLNNKPAKKSVVLSEGDEIELFFLDSPEITLTPENIPLEILYEDPWMIAVNKPAGMVVHPAPGHGRGTLVNALLHHCTTLPGEKSLRPGIVHRLDKETSGLIIAAKTAEAHTKLVNLFASRNIHKKYLAIAKGKMAKPTSHTSMMGRDPNHRQKMASLLDGGKEAITHFTPLHSTEKQTLILAEPKTGRTHQIRVHLKEIGHPILGDKIYAHTHINDPERQMLHAFRLTFIHPFTEKQITLEAPLPTDFLEQLQRLHLQLQIISD